MLQDLDTDLSRMFGHLFFKPPYHAQTGKPDLVLKITFALLSPWAGISCYFANRKTPPHNTPRPQDKDLSQDYDINEVIEMALSDHTSFSDIKHANKLIYSSAFPKPANDAFSKIGINCHLCLRHNCSQRAHDPLFTELNTDTKKRGETRYES